MDEAEKHAVVLFDGVCNFCNGTVNFVIEHDRANYFRFAPLQSEVGQKFIKEYELNSPGLDSVIVIEDGQAFTHSTAALKLIRRLSGIWSWAYIFIIVPKFIRDFFYKLFAKYRYRLFGKKDVCMMPTPEVRAKFLT